MTDVIDLAQGDIDRSGAGVSTNSAQPSGFRQDGGQAAPPAEMTTQQQAGIQHLADMRQRFSDPTLSGEQREMLLKNMSTLSRHVFQGTAKPAWYGDKTLDPRDTSTAEYDPMSSLNAEAGSTMSEADREQLVNHAKVKGMDSEAATLAVEFCTNAGLDKTTSRIVTDRIAHHAAKGLGTGATLTQEDHADLRAEAERRFGTVEKLNEVNAMARAYVEHVGMADWVDKNAGSVQYDPQVLSMLAYKARCLGLKAAT